MPDESPAKSKLDDAFANADAPVYLLDAQRTITFANDALAAWVGLAVDEITGRLVEYHSEPSAEAGRELLTGLCPPPTVLAGERGDGSVSTVGRDGRLRRRTAVFLPLPGDDADHQAGWPVLAVCGAEDLAVGELTTGGSSDTTAEQLHAALRQLRRRESDQRLHAALLGVGPATATLRRQVDAAVASGANALILGPLGSGRSELARVLFQRSSPGSSEKLVPVSAASLEPGPALNRIAAARASSAGSAVTLLLEEVGALPAEAQRTAAETLGEAPGVRVLATADDANAIVDPSLRALLATIVLTIPPLADRPEDLPLLAQWCVERVNAAEEKQVGGLTAAAVERLSLYTWPGGFAELRAVVAAAHARTKAAIIDADDLPTVIQQAALAAELPNSSPAVIALDDFLGRIEGELLRRALDLSGGNKAEAARLLGLSRPRLYRLMTRLGMTDEAEPPE